MCARVGGFIQTSNNVDGSFHKEVMWWLDNIIPDPISNNKHYFYPEYTRYIIETNKPSNEYQMKYLPASNNNDNKNRSARRDK